MSKFLKTIQENYPTTDKDLLLESCMTTFKKFLKSKGIECKTKGPHIQVKTDSGVYTIAVQPNGEEDSEVEELAAEVDPSMGPILKKRKQLVAGKLPKIKKKAEEINAKLAGI
jgi:hypothetical protein